MARKIRIATPAEIALLRQRVTEVRSCIKEAICRLNIIHNDALPSISTQFDQISITLRNKASANIEKDLISERERLSAEINALKKEERRLMHGLKGSLALNNILSLELEISEANVQMSGGIGGTYTHERHFQWNLVS